MTTLLQEEWSIKSSSSEMLPDSDSIKELVDTTLMGGRLLWGGSEFWLGVPPGKEDAPDYDTDLAAEFRNTRKNVVATLFLNQGHVVQGAIDYKKNGDIDNGMCAGQMGVCRGSGEGRRRE